MVKINENEKEAIEEYEKVIKQISEIEEKNKEFEKAYNRASVKGLRGEAERRKIFDDYEKFEEENFKNLEKEATKLRENLEMIYAQLEAVEKRTKKRKQKSES